MESTLSLFQDQPNTMDRRASGNTYGREHHGRLLDGGEWCYNGIRRAWNARVEIIAAWGVVALVRRSCRMRLVPW